jgi:hypothetical protein
MLGEGPDVERFAQKRQRCLKLIDGFSDAGDEHGLQVRSAFAEPSQKFDAAHAGQLEVGKNDIELLALFDNGERALGIRDCEGLVP